MYIYRSDLDEGQM